MQQTSSYSSTFFGVQSTRKLAQVMAPCFSLILHLRETSEFGDSDLLRSRILEMLKSAEKEAIDAAIPVNDIKDSRFAIVAFLDESILGSDWTGKASWVARPLQVQLYGQAVAGEEFFDRLQRIKADAHIRHDVLEVYYLCMALGFKGKYRIMGDAGQNELRILIEDTYTRLKATAQVDSKYLAPHGRPRDQIATEVRSKLPPWVVAVAAVSVGFVIYIIMSFMIRGALNDACASLIPYVSVGC